MSPHNRTSFLRVSDLKSEDCNALFSRAKSIKQQIQSGTFAPNLMGKQVALVFSEASTRTKMSFQMAAQRMGAQCLVIDNVTSSSMSKGETFADTFWTLHAIRPDLFVVRCGGNDPLLEVAETSEVPVINAGYGSFSHPTQALLDGFTLLEHYESLAGVKILLVGDIDHSRVAHSDIPLFQMLGADVKVCAPKSFSENLPEGVERIEKLSDAIAWCDVYMGLRVQFERHQGNDRGEIRDEFETNFSLNEEGLKALSPKAFIMHPGPVNWGVEFQECVQKDPRLLMWQQKENGVYTRAALIERVLGVTQ